MQRQLDSATNLWNLTDRSLQAKFRNAQGDTNRHLEFSHTGDLLAMVSDKGWARMWDARKESLLGERMLFDEPAVEFIDFRNLILVASRSGKVVATAVEDGRKIAYREDYPHKE